MEYTDRNFKIAAVLASSKANIGAWTSVDACEAWLRGSADACDISGMMARDWLRFANSIDTSVYTHGAHSDNIERAMRAVYGYRFERATLDLYVAVYDAWRKNI